MISKESYLSLIDKFKSSSVMILNSKKEVLYRNTGMKKLNIDCNFDECFTNPTWDKICSMIDDSVGESEIFEGVVTLKNSQFTDGSVSLEGRIFREGELILLILEYDLNDLINTVNDIYDLNKDITKLQRELMSKKKELEYNNNKLQKTVENQNKLLGMAAHDLRNPIGAIHSFVELMLDDPEDYELSEETTEILGIITESSSYMQYIISSLLDLSKINAGKLDLKYKESDLTILLNKVLQRNKFRAKTKNISLNVILKGNPVTVVSVDEFYIEQVLENLISNAMKYSFKDSEVNIEIYNEADKIICEIKDRGVGIPADEQHKLFIAFSKTSSQPTDNESSTGLGLAISQKVIESHQGKIGYKPNNPTGSIFWFSLLTSN